MTPAYYYKALSHTYHLIFMAILAGRNDYSSFPKDGTEAARSYDSSKATELGHGRSPLSSMPHLLHDNISSCRKCFSLSIYSSFLFKIIPWVMIIPSAGIKWRNGQLLPSYSLQCKITVQANKPLQRKGIKSLMGAERRGISQRLEVVVNETPESFSKRGTPRPSPPH